jgi:hypothetical protein
MKTGELLTHDDMERLLEGVGSKLDQINGKKPVDLSLISGQLRALNTVMEKISTTLIMESAKNLNAIHELSKRVQENNNVVKSTNENTIKSMREMLIDLTNTVSRMNKLFETSTKETKAAFEEAMDHSTQAIQAELKTTVKSVNAFEKGFEQVKVLTAHLGEVVTTLERQSRASKRARRQGDGTWVLEPYRRLDG